MLLEVQNYGTVFTEASAPPSSLTTSNLTFTSQNFDPSNPKKRPVGWEELRANRVAAKEMATGVNRSDIVTQRQLREKLEEDIMLAEVATYGTVLSIRPGSVLPLSNSNIHEQRLQDEDRIMLEEAKQYSSVLNLGTPNSINPLQRVPIDLSPPGFNPDDTTRRPAGWKELRAQRIHAKELVARSVSGLQMENISIRETKV
jgi:hypothetical protein